MAVNNLNPAAVPPTAAEIATAVAAPSAATIAAAVAAPSAATIAAAVAAPSAATIASTVAAPSSATITSAVLSAGNSAGWGTTGGDTWTAISTINTTNSATAFTFSSLSGYKQYKVVFNNCGAGTNQNWYFQINGSATTYNYMSRQLNSSSWTASGSNGGLDQVGMAPQVSLARLSGYLKVLDANTTGAKIIEGTFYSTQLNGTASTWWDVIGCNYASTSAVTSITFGCNTSGLVVGQATLYGGN
jgi:hypothetical protein